MAENTLQFKWIVLFKEGLGQRAEAERQRADRLVAKLREMGIEPE
jgi:hypothetical protein